MHNINILTEVTKNLGKSMDALATANQEDLIVDETPATTSATPTPIPANPTDSVTAATAPANLTTAADTIGQPAETEGDTK